MELTLDILSWVAIVGGSVLCLIGGFGLLRLPDVFTRMHAASVIDTLGMALILIGCMFQAGLSLVTIKLVMIVVFILFTSPATTHALARAALYHGVHPKTDDPKMDKKLMALEEDGSSKT